MLGTGCETEKNAMHYRDIAAEVRKSYSNEMPGNSQFGIYHVIIPNDATPVGVVIVSYFFFQKFLSTVELLINPQ
jgi:hypothetical protein